MSLAPADLWTDSASVLFTSFWGWRPETSATVGWSNDRGKSYRDNLLQRVSDPFITVVYVTRDPDGLGRDLVGKVAGFYLMSHETGHRNNFTHPVHHTRHPEKWVHSLRALRAFSYISDPLLVARDIEPDLHTGAAQAIASWGKVLTDPEQIRTLRETPWREVPVYRPDMPADALDDIVPGPGFVQAGPMASQEYSVSPSALALGRQLYVLRLDGDIDVYLGKSAGGRRIVKIGLSIRPESRRTALQKSMPLGAFRWRVERPVAGDASLYSYAFAAAVAGEYAMKKHLATCAEHLGGEFYLASDEQIEAAWRLGCGTAQSHAVEK